jgi:uncharacterized membrane protein YphA (DoxX/SURF4 family)
METATKTETAEGQARKRCCPISVTVVRVLMGLAFLAFGIMGFVMKPPQPMPEPMATIMTGFAKTGYLMPLICGNQIVVGLLLLMNRFVPLALALIAPLLLNIILFHVFVQPAGIAPGAVLSIFELYLAWSYRGAFAPMLAARATPGPACCAP